LVPLIIALTPEDEWCRRAITFLKAWDCRLSADSAAACIYEVFFTHLVRRTLEEKLGSWSDFFLGKGVHMLRPHTVFFHASHSWLMDKMREKPQWFGTTGDGHGDGKSWTEARGEALRSAEGDVRLRLGVTELLWR